MRFLTSNVNRWKNGFLIKRVNLKAENLIIRYNEILIKIIRLKILIKLNSSLITKLVKIIKNRFWRYKKLI